jgi:hypothetical protein
MYTTDLHSIRVDQEDPLNICKAAQGKPGFQIKSTL